MQIHAHVNFQSQFQQSITKACNFQLDHIWTNITSNEHKVGVTKTYQPYFHKLMYTTYKKVTKHHSNVQPSTNIIYLNGKNT